MTVHTAFIHMPGLALPDGPHGLAGGRLDRLDFDRWHGLDGSHVYAGDKYMRNAPIFWTGAIDDPGDIGLETALAAKATQLHQLFLLHPQAPAMASPLLSCRYAETEIEDVGTAWRRVIGLAEREWIVFGGVPLWTFDTAALAHLEPIAGLLAAVPAAVRAPALRAALDVLERTARPDHRFDSQGGTADAGGFVEMVAACEAVLREGADDDGGDGLAAAFARRAVAVFGGNAELAPGFTRIYDLRTRLIHGRIAGRDMGDADRAVLHNGRLLLRNICVASLVAAA